MLAGNKFQFQSNLLPATSSLSFLLILLCPNAAQRIKKGTLARYKIWLASSLSIKSLLLARTYLVTAGECYSFFFLFPFFSFSFKRRKGGRGQEERMSRSVKPLLFPIPFLMETVCGWPGGTDREDRRKMRFVRRYMPHDPTFLLIRRKVTRG